MTEPHTSALIRALRVLLRPVIRVVLRSGLSWQEVAEVCKLTLVEVASHDFGLHGRPTNMSRVAIMTGLSRREVSRLRHSLEAEAPAELGEMNAATRVLTGWHLDPEFVGPDGQPRALPADGGPGSFAALCHRYAGDIAAVTLQRELVRVGAVAVAADGRLEARQRFYMPAPQDPEAVLRAGFVLRDLGNTLVHNLGRDPGAATRFEGRASNPHLRVADTPAFRAFLEGEAQGLLERVDAWLSEHEASSSARQRYRTTRMGIGIYQIQDDDDWSNP